MPTRPFTLIDESRPVAVDAVVRGDGIRLSADAVERAVGWRLEPEGLCKDDTCVPVRDRAALLDADGLELAALARLLDRPLATEADEGVAVMAGSATDRAARLATMHAPDVTLPDLAGRLHSLRDQRGKKTLLIAWASW
jgi:hypothetical protein